MCVPLITRQTPTPRNIKPLIIDVNVSMKEHREPHQGTANAGQPADVWPNRRKSNGQRKSRNYSGC